MYGKGYTLARVRFDVTTCRVRSSLGEPGHVPGRFPIATCDATRLRTIDARERAPDEMGALIPKCKKAPATSGGPKGNWEESQPLSWESGGVSVSSREHGLHLGDGHGLLVTQGNERRLDLRHVGMIHVLAFLQVLGVIIAEQQV